MRSRPQIRSLRVRPKKACESLTSFLSPLDFPPFFFVIYSDNFVLKFHLKVCVLRFGNFLWVHSLAPRIPGMDLRSFFHDELLKHLEIDSSKDSLGFVFVPDFERSTDQLMVNWWFAGCVGGYPCVFFVGIPVFEGDQSWLVHSTKSPPNSPTRRWNHRCCLQRWPQVARRSSVLRTPWKMNGFVSKKGGGWFR